MTPEESQLLVVLGYCVCCVAAYIIWTVLTDGEPPCAA